MRNKNLSKKKILLIGRGPLPGSDEKGIGFSQLRLWSIWRFLQQQGHHITILDIEKDLNPFAAEAPAQIHQQSQNFDLCISAGPFLPALVASWIDSNLPLWIDWPSDPLADFHARLHAPDSDFDDSAWVAVQEVVYAALSRADAVAVISDRQRWATLGQWLLLGRQDSHLAQQIHTVPIAFDFPHPPEHPKNRVANSALTVVLCGSANTWLDDQKLCSELSHALQNIPKLSFVMLGGPVSGHYSAGWKRIQQWALAHPHRVQLHNWLPQEEFQYQLRKAHVGIWLDRTGVEPLLGSRTRALLYGWMGLSILGSPQSEMPRKLQEKGFLISIEGTGKLSQRLSQLYQQPRSQENLKKQFQFFEKQYAPKTVYAPLLQWLEQPRRLSTFQSPIHSILQEKQKQQQELSTIYASPTWKVSNRIHRALQRIRGLIG